MNDKLEFSKDLAYKAGKIMTQHFQIGLKYRNKKDNTPVTVADEAINKLVIEEVKSNYSGHGVLGEEESLAGSESDIWLVDPIDGTAPYMRGIPTNVFTLAYVKDGVPEVGVIYDPYQDRLFSASKGSGAFLNSDKISASKKADLDQAYISIEGRKLFSNLKYLETLQRDNVKTQKYHSVTYALAMTSVGQFDATIFSGRSPWDVAAAKVIIEEAGGVTSDITGKDQNYNRPINGFVASCTKQIHGDILTILSESIVQ